MVSKPNFEGDHFVMYVTNAMYATLVAIINNGVSPDLMNYSAGGEAVCPTSEGHSHPVWTGPR